MQCETSGYVSTQIREHRDVETRRVGSVPQKSHRIMALTDQLEKIVDDLHSRLVTVLSPFRPTVSEKECKDGQPCELATHLSDSGDRLERLLWRIGNFIERLEV